MDAQRTQELIVKYRKSETDTGSAAVQIIQLTERIVHLTAHLKVHKQDKHTQRGLLKLVGTRRRLLGYLEKTDLTLFRELKKELGIR